MLFHISRTAASLGGIELIDRGEWADRSGKTGSRHADDDRRPGRPGRHGVPR
ncbi:hypothetical protein [Streptomyces sp. NPDC095613]|uniref:hypothetical protein n=1 Tax=Streptomyces sp. NPDC095613 TaxID=3155540 RepID=UPI00331E4740